MVKEVNSKIVKSEKNEKKIKNIIHINELDEKAYNHLGVNLHAYKLENITEKDLENILKNNMVSKAFSEEEYIALSLDKKFPYETIQINNEKIKTVINSEKEEKVEAKENKKDKKEFKYIKFNSNEVLDENIEIYEKDTLANYIFEFGYNEEKKKELNKEEEKILRNFKLNIVSDTSSLNIIYIINKSNTFSLDNINLESKNGGSINFKYIIIGEDFSNIKHKSVAYKDSSINVSGIYLLSKNSLLDLFYEGIMKEENSKTNFHIEGIIKDTAKKISKDVLRFEKGAKNSVGIEKENIMILSDLAKCKTVPILLSREEDIIGEHGYSSGALGKDKIFYLMSRGVSKNDAIHLIVFSKIKKILFEGIEEFYEDEFLNEILERLEEYIKR